MRTLALTGLLAVTLLACGIPADSEPEVLDLELVTPSEEAPPAVGALAAVSIYLVRDETLVHVTRDLPAPASPVGILDSLVRGVTGPEVRANLRTAIPPETRIVDVSIDGTVLNADLTQEFAGIGGQEEVLAVAQIVLTATSIEGIRSVAFKIEGIPTSVPIANGALSVEPVGPDDYMELVAP